MIRIELDPNYVLAYITRAESYNMKGDYGNAIHDASKSIELDKQEKKKLFTINSQLCHLVVHLLVIDILSVTVDCNNSRKRKNRCESKLLNDC